MTSFDLDLAISAFVLFGRRNPCGSVVAISWSGPVPSMQLDAMRHE
jgi:hypothetical protein